MRVLIATVKRPNTHDVFAAICTAFREQAVEMGAEIAPGLLWTRGPGCYNVAFDVVGDDAVAESIANCICLTLQPGKWTTTKDQLPEVDTLDI